MTISATASVPTAHASKYLQQLCKHFGHKIPVEVTGEAALLRFDAGEGRLVPQPGGIALSVEAATAEDTAMLADVLERHLLRFAHREDPAALVWAAE